VLVFVIFRETKIPQKWNHKSNPKPKRNRKTNLNLNPNFENFVENRTA